MRWPVRSGGHTNQVEIECYRSCGNFLALRVLMGVRAAFVVRRGGWERSSSCKNSGVRQRAVISTAVRCNVLGDWLEWMDITPDRI